MWRFESSYPHQFNKAHAELYPGYWINTSMEKFLKSLSDLLKVTTLRRVVLVIFLLLASLAMYMVYANTENISSYIFSKDDYPPELTTITPQSEALIKSFMSKHNGTVIYLTVLRFDFPRNTRTPIYRSFNSDELKKLVYDRLKGGDGALPIFIKNDKTNNDQIITLVHGEVACDPFTGGGLARVWPDLESKLKISCRIPIPPIFGSVRGYIVIHIIREMTPYELEAMKIDLKNLVIKIHEDNKK